MYNYQSQCQQQGNKRIWFGIVTGITEVFTIVPNANSIDMYTDMTGEWVAELDINSYRVIKGKFIGTQVQIADNKQSLINTIYYNNISSNMSKPVFGQSNIPFNNTEQYMLYKCNDVPGFGIGPIRNIPTPPELLSHPAINKFVSSYSKDHEYEMKILYGMSNIHDPKLFISVIATEILSLVKNIVYKNEGYTDNHIVERLPFYLELLNLFIDNPIDLNKRLPNNIISDKIVYMRNATTLKISFNDDFIKDLQKLYEDINVSLCELGYKNILLSEFFFKGV